VACVWWVLAWAGAWKLTTPERLPDRRASFVAGAARWLGSIYLVLPFAWAWATWDDMYVRGVRASALLALAFVGWASAFLLLVRLGLVVRQLRRRWAPLVEAWILAVLVPCVATFAALLERRGGSTSLSLMFGLPAFPYGVPSLFQGVLRWLPRFRSDWAELLTWALLVGVPLWSLSLMLRVLVWSRPRGENAVTSAEASA
jgi:hypothetical protein